MLRGGGMVRKSILIVAIVLAIGVGLAGGYILWRSRGYICSPTEIEVVALDSFVLVDPYSLTEAEAIECQTLHEELGENFTSTLPLDKCGLYYNKFFLEQGESIEIVVRSNMPMGPDLVNQQHGLEIMYWMSYSMPYEKETGYFEQLIWDDSYWEIRDTFVAEADGFFHIYVENLAKEQAWCQYVIFLKDSRG